jgi:DNA-binding transcriptional LysR family regulator
MNEIDLQRVDLNLLVVFDTLMGTRSVSQAAQQLSRTQSAVSHALERLRQQLNEPLLVRQGGEMVPSPFALRLHAQLQPLLKQLAQSLAPPEDFVPSSTQRRFTLAMRDFLAGLFPDLLHLMQARAPQAQLEWLLVPDDVFVALLAGDLDVFIGPTPLANMPAGIAMQPCGGLQWSCFARSDHPALAQWGQDAWSHWPHLMVGVSDAARSTVAIAAREAGCTRHVQSRVPLFSAVAPALANSNLIATLPRAVMHGSLTHWGLVELPTPFPIEPIGHAMYWARRLEGDAGLAWFRAQVQEALGPFVDVAATDAIHGKR